MATMRVRYVRRHAPSGSDVAVLGPASAEPRPPCPLIALSLTRSEAIELTDELDGKPTPRAGVYDVLESVLGAAGASVVEISVLEAPGQAAQARVHFQGARGPSELQVEVAQALGLSVRTGLPLQVSDRLIANMTPPPRPAPMPEVPPEATGPCTISGPAGDPPDRDPSHAPAPPANQPTGEAASDVPEQFRRAFDDV